MDPVLTRIETYKLGILFAQARTAMISNFVNAFVLAFLLKDAAPRGPLLAWLVTLCSLTVVRSYVNYRFRRALQANPTSQRVETTQRAFTVLLTVAGLVWGSISFLTPHTFVPEQMLVGFVLAGMSAGAVSTYSMLPWAAQGFVYAAVGPYLLSLLVGGSRLFTGAAVMTVLYLLLMTRIARLLSRHIHKSIALGFENESLLKHQQDQNAELLNVNAQLSRAKEELIGAVQLASIGGIAANLSHEINNPMMIVTGRMQQIRDQIGASSPIVPLLDSIARALERVQKSLRSFRTFSNDPTIPRHERVALNDVIDAATASYLARFGERSVPLIVHKGEATLVVMGDAAMLAHTIFSLMQNSHEAQLGTDAPNAWIGLRSFAEGDQAVIEVSDGGAGIAPELRDRIFDPFLTTKDGGVSKGQGLGLTFARNIAARHGGQLTLTDKPETTFRLVLPLADRLSRAA